MTALSCTTQPLVGTAVQVEMAAMPPPARLELVRMAAIGGVALGGAIYSVTPPMSASPSPIALFTEMRRLEAWADMEGMVAWTTVLRVPTVSAEPERMVMAVHYTSTEMPPFGIQRLAIRAHSAGAVVTTDKPPERAVTPPVPKAANGYGGAIYNAGTNAIINCTFYRE